MLLSLRFSVVDPFGVNNPTSFAYGRFPCFHGTKPNSGCYSLATSGLNFFTILVSGMPVVPPTASKAASIADQ